MTDKQFKFIEEQFKDEVSRDEYLSKKAQVYLSINSIIITALIFKVKDLKDLVGDPSCLEKVLIVFSFVSIFISFLFVLFTLGIYNFERPTDTDTLTEEQENSITDTDFIENRASDYLVAFEENALIGDRKATYLTIALISMIVCFTSSLILILNTLL